MTEPYLGEIQIFGFNFAPRQWAMCNGATLSVSQNAALFSLLGTSYGGNGSSTFQIPNLANRSPCSQGQGPALTDRVIGEPFGSESVTLLQTEIPQHNHTAVLYKTGVIANKAATPATGYGLAAAGKPTSLLPNGSPNTTFAPNMIGATTGGNQPHDNHQPYLAITFAIAMAGNFPAFN